MDEQEIRRAYAALSRRRRFGVFREKAKSRPVTMEVDGLGLDYALSVPSEMVEQIVALLEIATTEELKELGVA